MSLSYHCPHCRGLLNPGNRIIVVVEHGSDSGFLLLSPDLGDYTVVHNESKPLVPGTLYTLRCSVCRHDLVSPVDDRLAEILCRKADGTEARVNFSRIAGEHATFVGGPGGLESYGEDADRYAGLNFFGAGKSGTHERP